MADDLPPIPQQRSYPKMLASEKLINFIKDKEKFYSEPYSDFKQWSIGYGSYAGKLTGDPTIKSITKDGADKLLKQEIKKYEANVNKFNTFYNFTQNEFDAMVSFAYNLGSINQLTDNGNRSKEQILQKMPDYNKAGGKVAGGLVTRRKEEVSIFKGENTPKAYDDSNVAASSLRDENADDPIAKIISKSRDGKSTSTNEDQDYPVLTEKAEQLKGEVAGGFVSLAANMFPDRAAAAITSSLPSNIANLPSASKISGEILESIRSGEGVKSFTSAVEKISSADTPVGRLQAIGDIAKEYEADIKALYPDLGNIDFDEVIPEIIDLSITESPKERIIKAIELAEKTGIGLEEIDSLSIPGFPSIREIVKNPDKIPDVKDKRFGIPVPGAKIDNYLRDLLGSDDIAVQKEAIENLKNSAIGGLFEEYQAETFLTGSLEDIVKTPLVTEQLGNLPERLLTAERPKAIETALTRFAGDIISEETDGAIDRNTSQTLLAGGTEEEAKKMRQTIGGMALDNFIESNPNLAGIVQWFSENKELITLLGSAGALAGLSGLLGGGALGGFAAGAGGLAGVRMLLGKDGYDEFQDMIKTAASPVFDFASEALESSGLADIPVIGAMLKGTVGIGKENPLAATAALTGNFSMAAGLMAGQSGIDIFDQEKTAAGLLAGLTDSFNGFSTQVQQDLAAVGNTNDDQRQTPTSKDGNPAEQTGQPAAGSQRSMYDPLAVTTYQGFGYSGPGGIVSGGT